MSVSWSDDRERPLSRFPNAHFSGWLMLTGWRGPDGLGLLGLSLVWRIVGSRVIPILGYTRRTALHDVADLVLVDGLVFDQSIGHSVQLIEVGREDALGALKVRIDNPTHFLIDGMGRHIRHL